MTILYHHPLSAGSRYVRLVLAEYGETVELIERHPLERDEEFLALNPAGTLPVLVDDTDGAIVGTSVIAEYLFETRPIKWIACPPVAPDVAGSTFQRTVSPTRTSRTISPP